MVLLNIANILLGTPGVASICEDRISIGEIEEVENQPHIVLSMINSTVHRTNLQADSTATGLVEVACCAGNYEDARLLANKTFKALDSLENPDQGITWLELNSEDEAPSRDEIQTLHAVVQLYEIFYEKDIN